MGEQWFRTSELEFRSDLATNQIHRILVSPPVEVQHVPGRMVVLESEWSEYQKDSDESHPNIYRSEQIPRGTIVRVLTWPGGDYHGGGASAWLVNPTDGAEILLQGLSPGSDGRTKAETRHGRLALSSLVSSIRKVCDVAEITPRELLISILGNGHQVEHSSLPLACQMAAEQIEDELQSFYEPLEIQVDGARWLTDGSAAWRAEGPQPVRTMYLRREDRTQIQAGNAGAFVSAMVKKERVYLDPDSSNGFLKFLCKLGVTELMVDDRFAPVLEGCSYYIAWHTTPTLLVYDESGYRAMVGGVR